MVQIANHFVKDQVQVAAQYVLRDQLLVAAGKELRATKRWAAGKIKQSDPNASASTEKDRPQKRAHKKTTSADCMKSKQGIEGNDDKYAEAEEVKSSSPASTESADTEFAVLADQPAVRMPPVDIPTGPNGLDITGDRELDDMQLGFQPLQGEVPLGLFESLW